MCFMVSGIKSGGHSFKHRHAKRARVIHIALPTPKSISAQNTQVKRPFRILYES